MIRQVAIIFFSNIFIATTVCPRISNTSLFCGKSSSSRASRNSRLGSPSTTKNTSVSNRFTSCTLRLFNVASGFFGQLLKVVPHRYEQWHKCIISLCNFLLSIISAANIPRQITSPSVFLAGLFSVFPPPCPVSITSPSTRPVVYDLLEISLRIPSIEKSQRTHRCSRGCHLLRTR
jgi:hypothetical protein